MSEKLGNAPQAAPEAAPVKSAEKSAENKELNDAEVIDYLNNHPELRAQIVKSTLELVDLSDPIKVDGKAEVKTETKTETKTEEKTEEKTATKIEVKEAKPEEKTETKVEAKPKKLTKEEAEKAEKDLLEEEKEIRIGKTDIVYGPNGIPTVYYDKYNKYEPKTEKNEQRDALAESVDKSEFAFITSLEDPLKSDEAVQKVIDQYLEGNLDPDAVDAEPTPEDEETKAAREALEAKLYSKWTDELRSMTQEQIDQGVEDGTLEKPAFESFRKEALRVIDAGQANTPDELYVAFDKRLANVVTDEARRKERLTQIFNRYGAPTIGEDGSFVARSLYKSESTRLEDVQEVLYLGLNKKNSYDLVSQFVDSADEAGISYNIGGNLNTDKRSDAIQINVSTANLRASVAILKKIAEQNPQLLEDRGEPSPFTSNVDGWIGVASEPLDAYVDEDGDAHIQTFLEKRSRIAKDAILGATYSWIGRHAKDVVKVNGRETTVSEFYADIDENDAKRDRLIKFIVANQPKNFIMQTRANMLRSGRKHGISAENFAIDTRNSQNLALQDNANKLRDIRERRAEALEDTAA